MPERTAEYTERLVQDLRRGDRRRYLEPGLFHQLMEGLREISEESLGEVVAAILGLPADLHPFNLSPLGPTPWSAKVLDQLARAAVRALGFEGANARPWEAVYCMAHLLAEKGGRAALLAAGAADILVERFESMEPSTAGSCDILSNLFVGQPKMPSLRLVGSGLWTDGELIAALGSPNAKVATAAMTILEHLMGTNWGRCTSGRLCSGWTTDHPQACLGGLVAALNGGVYRQSAPAEILVDWVKRRIVTVDALFDAGLAEVLPAALRRGLAELNDARANYSAVVELVEIVATTPLGRDAVRQVLAVELLSLPKPPPKRLLSPWIQAWSAQELWALRSHPARFVCEAARDRLAELGADIGLESILLALREEWRAESGLCILRLLTGWVTSRALRVEELVASGGDVLHEILEELNRVADAAGPGVLWCVVGELLLAMRLADTGGDWFVTGHLRSSISSVASAHAVSEPWLRLVQEADLETCLTLLHLDPLRNAALERLGALGCQREARDRLQALGAIPLLRHEMLQTSRPDTDDPAQGVARLLLLRVLDDLGEGLPEITEIARWTARLYPRRMPRELVQAVQRFPPHSLVEAMGCGERHLALLAVEQVAVLCADADHPGLFKRERACSALVNLADQIGASGPALDARLVGLVEAAGEQDDDCFLLAHAFRLLPSRIFLRPELFARISVQLGKSGAAAASSLLLLDQLADRGPQQRDRFFEHRGVESLLRTVVTAPDGPLRQAAAARLTWTMEDHGEGARFPVRAETSLCSGGGAQLCVALLGIPEAAEAWGAALRCLSVVDSALPHAIQQDDLLVLSRFADRAPAVPRDLALDLYFRHVGLEELVGALGGSDPRAAAALRRIGTLAERKAALRAAGAVGAVLEYLRSGAIARRLCLEVIVDLLDSRHPEGADAAAAETVARACGGLVSAGPDETRWWALALLGRVLQEPQYWGPAAGWGVASALLNTILRTQDHAVRDRATALLGRISTLRSLAKLLEDERNQVVGAAVTALQLRAEQDSDCDDSDPTEVLGVLQESQRLPRLVAMARPGSGADRPALLLLATLVPEFSLYPPPSAFITLRGLMNAGVIQSCWEALRLDRPGRPELLPEQQASLHAAALGLLERLTQWEDARKSTELRDLTSPLVRYARSGIEPLAEPAIAILARVCGQRGLRSEIRSAGGLDAAIRLLSSRSTKSQAAAARVIGILGVWRGNISPSPQVTASVLDELEGLLDEEETQDEAALALGRFGRCKSWVSRGWGGRTVPILVDLLNADGTTARIAAAEAVSLLVFEDAVVGACARAGLGDVLLKLTESGTEPECAAAAPALGTVFARTHDSRYPQAVATLLKRLEGTQSPAVSDSVSVGLRRLLQGAPEAIDYYHCRHGPVLVAKLVARTGSADAARLLNISISLPEWGTRLMNSDTVGDLVHGLPGRTIRQQIALVKLLRLSRDHWSPSVEPTVVSRLVRLMAAPLAAASAFERVRLRTEIAWVLARVLSRRTAEEVATSSWEKALADLEAPNDPVASEAAAALRAHLAALGIGDGRATPGPAAERE